VAVLAVSGIAAMIQVKPEQGYRAELRDTLRMTLERQEWYRDYSLHNDYAPLSWPGVNGQLN